MLRSYVFSIYLSKTIYIAREPTIDGSKMTISLESDLINQAKISYLIATKHIDTLTLTGDDIKALNQFNYFKNVKYFILDAGGVKDLPANLFQNSPNIRKVVLHNKVTAIGESCFMDSSLSEINLDDVQTIGLNAFAKCYNLKEIRLLKLQSVDNYAFTNSSVSSIVIGDDLTEIGNYFASNCFFLKSVTIGKNVQKIGDGAFNSCSNLTDFPFSTITTIGNFAFQRTSLISLELTNKVTIVGQYAFAFSKLTSVTFANEDTPCTLGKYCFYRCQYLTSVSISSNYKLSDHLFEECMKLESIAINHSQVPQYFATGCFALKTFTSQNLVRVRRYGFYMCENLTTIDLSNMIQIEIYAFAYCTNLTITEWPQQSQALFYLYPSAFMYCPKIKISYIPDFYSLSNGVFQGCTGIEEIKVKNSALPGAIFQGCTNLRKVVLRNMSVISGSAFACCPNLVSVTIDESVNVIFGSAFASSGPIEMLDLSNMDQVFHLAFKNSGVKALKFYKKPNLVGTPFDSCPNLEKIILGPSWNSFEPLKFFNCTNLTNIELIDNTNLTVVDGILYNFDMSVLYYYFSASHREEFSIQSSVVNIQSYAFCNALNIDKLIISNFAYFSERAFYNCTCIQELEYNIKTKPDYNAKTMAGIKFEPSLSDMMFMNCMNLKTVNVMTEVLSIGANCFANCQNLETVTLPTICASCGDGAFCNCTSLTEMDFSHMCHIPANCFQGCTKLSDVSLSKTVSDIGASAFEATAITEIEIPNSVIDLGYSCFRNCMKLKTVTLGLGLTSIPGDDGNGNLVGWFFGSSIEILVIPNNIIEISPFAFINCKNIRIRFVDKEHPLFVIQDQALIDKTSGTLITTIGTLPQVYRIPETVSILGPFSINPYIENVNLSGIKVFDKGFGSPIIEIPGSVKTINKDSFTLNTYMYTLCYEGEYGQSATLSNNFLVNSIVTTKYGNQKLFDAFPEVRSCDEEIPKQFKYRFILGWTPAEIALLTVSIIFLVAIISIGITVLVLTCKKNRCKTEAMP